MKVKKLFSFLFLGLDVVDEIIQANPPEPLQPTGRTPPLIVPVVNQKNDQNTTASEALLISKVAPSLQSKAKLLLKAFNENPQQLTWNDKGELFVNDESVPNANIFDLLPAVFKISVQKNKKLPGFIDFVNQIGNMGLAHLIHPKLLRGFKRQKKIIDQDELYVKVTAKDKKWYFLGPI